MSNDKKRKAAKALSLLGLGDVKYEDERERYEGIEVPPERYPKRFTPGQLERGDSVWYRGERYWIEWFPDSWQYCVTARISDHRPPPIGRNETLKRLSFMVPVDILELAPTSATPHTIDPSKADIERKERLASGQKDVGDPVAVALRDCADLDEVYWLTAHHLNTPEEELKAKYAHLNPGQQRMVLGNRLRAAYKAGKIRL